MQFNIFSQTNKVIWEYLKQNLKDFKNITKSLLFFQVEIFSLDLNTCLWTIDLLKKLIIPFLVAILIIQLGKEIFSKKKTND